MVSPVSDVHHVRVHQLYIELGGGGAPRELGFNPLQVPPPSKAALYEPTDPPTIPLPRPRVIQPVSQPVSPPVSPSVVVPVEETEKQQRMVIDVFGKGAART